MTIDGLILDLEDVCMGIVVPIPIDPYRRHRSSGTLIIQGILECTPADAADNPNGVMLGIVASSVPHASAKVLIFVNRAHFHCTTGPDHGNLVSALAADRVLTSTYEIHLRWFTTCLLYTSRCV